MHTVSLYHIRSNYSPHSPSDSMAESCKCRWSLTREAGIFRTFPHDQRVCQRWLQDAECTQQSSRFRSWTVLFRSARSLLATVGDLNIEQNWDKLMTSIHNDQEWTSGSRKRKKSCRKRRNTTNSSATKSRARSFELKSHKMRQDASPYRMPQQLAMFKATSTWRKHADTDEVQTVVNQSSSNRALPEGGRKGCSSLLKAQVWNCSLLRWRQTDHWCSKHSKNCL